MNSFQNIDSELREQLHHHLKITGEGIKAFAKRAKIAEPTLFYFANGKKSVTVKTAQKIARHLNT